MYSSIVFQDTVNAYKYTRENIASNRVITTVLTVSRVFPPSSRNFNDLNRNLRI